MLLDPLRLFADSMLLVSSLGYYECLAAALVSFSLENGNNYTFVVE